MNGLQKQRGKSKTRAVIVLLATWLLGSACARDDVVAPSDTDAMPEFRPAVAAQIARWRPLKDTIPPREIPRWAPRPWDAGPESLKEYVAQTGGRVAIGLKSPSEPRTAASGIIPGISRQLFTAALEGIIGEDVTVIETYRNLTGVSAVIDPDAVDRLLALPFVNYIEPDIPATLAAPQDTSWGVEKIRAPAAWDAGHRGYAAHIWILDTGVDDWHADPNNEGDWHLLGGMCGWAVPLQDCYDGGGIAHGGLVHTVAVGPNNAVGYLGVAHDVHENFMIRVCSPGCPVGATASAIDSAISRGNPRTIINMSFGGVDPSTLRYESVAAAWNSGILLVAAAGNNNFPGSGILYPARHSEVIAVTGTTSSDGFAGPGVMACGHFSNSGPQAELSAPFEQSGIGPGGSHYQTQCGTSFAAPAVVGVAALVWDKYRTWTASQVRTHLQNTAKGIGMGPRNSYFGYGRVDACDAVQCQVDFDISGPYDLDPGEDGTWTVTNKSGGDGSGYSYQWYEDGELQSGAISSSYTTSFLGEEPYDHDIAVDVTPYGGLSRMKTITVWVSECPEGEEWCG